MLSALMSILHYMMGFNVFNSGIVWWYGSCPIATWSLWWWIPCTQETNGQKSL